MKLSPSAAASVFCLAHLLAACSSPSDQASPANSDSAAAAEAVGDGTELNARAEASATGKTKAAAQAAPARSSEPGPGPMPAKFSGIYEVLKGATLEKEPSNMAYNAHAEPTVALRWFARYGDEAAVRIFALRALGLYPTPKNTEVLAEVALNDKEDSAVRAGALRGVGRYDLEQEGLSAIKEFIFAAVASKDLVLAAAATDAMHGMPTARPILVELSSNPKTPAPVKAAAERALGPQVE